MCFHFHSHFMAQDGCYSITCHSCILEGNRKGREGKKGALLSQLSLRTCPQGPPMISLTLFFFFLVITSSDGWLYLKLQGSSFASGVRIKFQIPLEPWASLLGLHLLVWTSALVLALTFSPLHQNKDLVLNPRPEKWWRQDILLGFHLTFSSRMGFCFRNSFHWLGCTSWLKSGPYLILRISAT